MIAYKNPMQLEAAREKMKAAREKHKQARADQAIVFGDWRIERSDEMNWVIRYKNERQVRGHYYRLVNALQALPDKILNAEAKSSLAEILAALRRIQATIAEAVEQAKIKGVLSE